MNSTVTVRLTNSLNISDSFSMTVMFECTLLNRTRKPATDPFYDQMLLKVQKQTTKPTARIVSVGLAGLLSISFDQLMTVPVHPSIIGNTTVLINGTYFPILELTVIPGAYSNLRLLKFNWTFQDFQPTFMLLQLNFENPL